MTSRQFSTRANSGTRALRGNAEAVSGAAAIVNLARRSIMPVPMTEKEAVDNGVAPSERFRYFKLVDAKSNFAPRSTDNPWYRLHNISLPNPEPPVYPHGDNVQAIARITLPLLKDAAATAEDLKIKRVLLNLIDRGKIIDGKPYPYSPSLAGAKNERGLLQDAINVVRNEMAICEWRPTDLKTVTKHHVDTMSAKGWLAVGAMEELTSNPGRFRKGRGLKVVWSLTPWPSAGGGTEPDGGQLVNSSVN